MGKAANYLADNFYHFFLGLMSFLSYYVCDTGREIARLLKTVGVKTKCLIRTEAKVR